MIEPQFSAPLRMPAEWEPHRATWISWPHLASLFPGQYDAAQEGLARLVALVSENEAVHINVTEEVVEDRAARLIREAGGSGEVTFHRHPIDDVWCRDSGPTFALDADRDLVAIDWDFNAWGGKYAHGNDGLLAERIAAAMNCGRVAGDIIMEGGAIETNGDGLLLASSCLLYRERNGEAARARVERQFADLLGAKEVVWVDTVLHGDDTDGHVDTFARFVRSDVLVLQGAGTEQDPNHESLVSLRRFLEGHPALAAREVKIHVLPPSPSIMGETGPLPATYANFYFSNRCLIMPGYGVPEDRDAAQLLAALAGGIEVITVDARGVIAGQGAFHCLTQQVPL